MGGDTTEGQHRWWINDGEDRHGYGVICTRCHLELVPCVDLPASGVPRPRLYIAGRSEAYSAAKHGVCP